MTIEVRNLTKRYDGKTIIDDISFTVDAGEFVSLLGPSGCGKTTTLRCIAGFEAPDGGSISIAGRRVADHATATVVPPYQRNIGMVFQSYAIWPHLNVFENVAFPLRIRRVPSAEVARRVDDALDMVGLLAKRTQSAQQLSGGQQQRVAVARAIVQSPSIMLFDEPLSNLDANLRDTTRAEIRRIQRELGVAALYVTHDQAEALSLSDRVLVMNNGRIMQVGDPVSVYAKPSHSFVAKAVGASNFLNIKVENFRDEEADIILPGGIAATVRSGISCRSAERCQLLVRPDQVVLSRGPARGHGTSISGTVQQKLFLGGHYEYLLETDGQTLRAFSKEVFDEGEQLVLLLDENLCTLVAID